MNRLSFIILLKLVGYSVVTWLYRVNFSCLGLAIRPKALCIPSKWSITMSLIYFTPRFAQYTLPNYFITTLPAIYFYNQWLTEICFSSWINSNIQVRVTVFGIEITKFHVHLSTLPSKISQ